MGTGYVRNDTGNNIADGNVINASDLDGEFDAVQSAFNGSTGHSHDGTTGEGPQIDTAGIADSAVETAKINDGAVTTDKLGADAVTGAKIGDDQIDSEHYVALSIDREHLAADIIDGTKIADDVIDSEHYAAGSIDNEHLADDAVTGAKIDSTTTVTAASFVGPLTGNADTATALATARTIAGNSFDGTANITIASTDLSDSGSINATTLDSIDSTSFLRSDAADTKTSGDLSFSDNVKAVFGTGSDLQIYHDGSNSYISDEGTGNLILRGNNLTIKNADGSDNYITCTNDAEVTIRYNGATKLQTTNTGVSVTGTVTADGVSLGDNEKAQFGASNDLQIYHDGLNSYIDDQGTGDLNIRAANNFYVYNSAGTKTLFRAADGAGNYLFHDNAQKLSTTSGGVAVTGNVYASGDIGLDGSDFVRFTDNSQIDFYVNGTNEFRMEADGDFHADGDVIAYSTTISDERLKTNIVGIENAVAKVGQLNGYTFEYKADGKVSAGVIAQEVEAVLPEAVTEKLLPLKTDDGQEYKVVNYDALHGLLIEAIKELSARVEALEAK